MHELRFVSLFDQGRAPASAATSPTPVVQPAREDVSSAASAAAVNRRLRGMY